MQDLKGALLEKALALPANIRLGWKGLPGTKAQAYYELFFDRKKFYNIGPWGSILLFFLRQ